MKRKGVGVTFKTRKIGLSRHSLLLTSKFQPRRQLGLNFEVISSHWLTSQRTANNSKKNINLPENGMSVFPRQSILYFVFEDISDRFIWKERKKENHAEKVKKNFHSGTKKKEKIDSKEVLENLYKNAILFCGRWNVFTEQMIWNKNQ